MAGRTRTTDGATGAYGYGPQRESAKKLFAQKFHRLQISKGWSQAEISRKSGIGKDLISHYARGNHLPDPANARALAAAFDVPVEHLFPEAGGDVVPNTPFKMEQILGSDKWLVQVSVSKEMTQADALRLMALVADGENEPA